MVISNLVSYQLYPLSIAMAEDAQLTDAVKIQEEDNRTVEESDVPTKESSEASVDQDFSEEENITNKDVSESLTEEASVESEKKSDSEKEQSAVSEDLQESMVSANANLAPTESDSTSQEVANHSEPFWKSCLLDEEKILQLTEEESCQECAEKTTCEEVIICIKTKISNSNIAIINNETSSLSDTGKNTIDATPISQNDPSLETLLADEQPNEESENINEITSAVTETSENSLPEESTIDTGNATAETVIVNNINTNIVTENGEKTVQEIFDYMGDINLLEIFLAILEKANASDEKRTAALEIFNKNYAQIENIAKSEAKTGNNTISGDGSIETGNAEAAGIIVNIVNQNIVGSKWLLTIINVFGTWIGDLIVPGEGLLVLPESTTYSDLEVLNENTANISNTANATSDSGSNTATGSANMESNATIQTGSTYANNVVTTIANTNIIKNNWFMLIINNMGSWIGSVFGYDSDSETLSRLYSFDFASLIGTNDQQTHGSLTVHNENYAEIKNTAAAEATTGSNELQGNGKISTGNAYSQSAILNFVNSNFVGNNWLFGMVNIFGKWDGNLVFAYPDLKISIDDGKDEVYPAEKIDYNITVTNIGQATANKTHISYIVPEDLSLLSGLSSWDIASLDPGSSQEFTVSTQAKAISPSQPKKIIAIVSVDTETKEKEKTNNSAQDETALLSLPNASITPFYSEYDLNDYDSKLSISRTVSPSEVVSPGKIVKHSIVVKNRSDFSLYNVVLKDKVTDVDGNKLGTYEWPLGDMGKNDALLIEYEIIGNTPSASTTLTYEASAKGEDQLEHKIKSRKISLLINFLGGTAYAANSNSGEIKSETSLPILETGSVLGEMTENKEGLPFWIWILSIAILLLLISLFLLLNKRNFFLKRK